MADDECEKCRCNKYCGLVNTCEMTKEVYETGVEDGQESAVEYLVKNGYIKWGFETDYLLEQIKNSKEVEHEHT